MEYSHLNPTGGPLAGGSLLEGLPAGKSIATEVARFLESGIEGTNLFLCKVALACGLPLGEGRPQEGMLGKIIPPGFGFHIHPALLYMGWVHTARTSTKNKDLKKGGLTLGVPSQFSRDAEPMPRCHQVKAGKLLYSQEIAPATVGVLKWLTYPHARLFSQLLLDLVERCSEASLEAVLEEISYSSIFVQRLTQAQFREFAGGKQTLQESLAMLEDLRLTSWSVPHQMESWNGLSVGPKWVNHMLPGIKCIPSVEQAGRRHRNLSITTHQQSRWRSSPFDNPLGSDRTIEIGWDAHILGYAYSAKEFLKAQRKIQGAEEVRKFRMSLLQLTRPSEAAIATFNTFSRISLETLVDQGKDPKYRERIQDLLKDVVGVLAANSAMKSIGRARKRGTLPSPAAEPASCGPLGGFGDGVPSPGRHAEGWVPFEPHEGSAGLPVSPETSPGSPETSLRSPGTSLRSPETSLPSPETGLRRPETNPHWPETSLLNSFTHSVPTGLRKETLFAHKAGPGFPAMPKAGLTETKTIRKGNEEEGREDECSIGTVTVSEPADSPIGSRFAKLPKPQVESHGTWYDSPGAEREVGPGDHHPLSAAKLPPFWTSQAVMRARLQWEGLGFQPTDANGTPLTPGEKAYYFQPPNKNRHLPWELEGRLAKLTITPSQILRFRKLSSLTNAALEAIISSIEDQRDRKGPGFPAGKFLAGNVAGETKDTVMLSLRMHLTHNREVIRKEMEAAIEVYTRSVPAWVASLPAINGEPISGLAIKNYLLLAEKERASHPAWLGQGVDHPGYLDHIQRLSLARRELGAALSTMVDQKMLGAWFGEAESALPIGIVRESDRDRKIEQIVYAHVLKYFHVV